MFLIKLSSNTGKPTINHKDRAQWSIKKYILRKKILRKKNLQEKNLKKKKLLKKHHDYVTRLHGVCEN